MARAVHRLTVRKIEGLKKAALYPDGGNLYFRVAPGGSKSWVFRYSLNGRTRDAGAGPYPTITLAEARERAAQWRRLLVDGIDPIAQREAQRSSERAANAKSITFGAAATAYIAAHEASWRNAVHRSQWSNSLAAYAMPVLGKLPVSEIDTGLVLQVLEPIWKEKPETASRIRGRIESVLDWAKVRNFRNGENPARWRGHLDHLLPSKSKIQRIAHHPALPYAEIRTFMADLRKQGGAPARALEFLILTAARAGEVIGATWSEIDVAGKAWTIPAGRMKAHREHKVPLSARAMAILTEMRAISQNEFVFPGRRGKLSELRVPRESDITVHGFRSTFRDWAAERTNFPREMAEMALAHSVGSAVEAAYRRTDLFDKRRKLMQAWADYCAKPSGAGTVVPILARQVMPRGGKKAGAGRKRHLTPTEREKVARQHHDRMKAYAAAQAYVRDPNTKERRKINKQMINVAKTHKAMAGDERELLDLEEDVVWAHKQIWPKIEKLKAGLDSIPNESATTPRRAKGPRDRFIQELAEEWNISTRMVKSCINEFKNIF